LENDPTTNVFARLTACLISCSFFFLLLFFFFCSLVLVPSLVRIPPYHYLHVLDQNSNVTRLEIGPRTFVRQDHEKVLVGPAKNIIIPPRQYCIIENPVVVDEGGKVVFDDAGQAKLRHADREIRLSQVRFLLLFSFFLFFLRLFVLLSHSHSSLLVIFVLVLDFCRSPSPFTRARPL